MNWKFTFIFVVALGYSMHGQIAQYNQFPTMRPSHILDEKLDDISFAFGMRILESDYEGPLVQLRRASDNAIQDFYAADLDIVDVDAIDTWRAGTDVFVVRWYDQSGLGRDAIQNIQNRQPQFFPDPTQPYFQGDGTNDKLEVGVSIQLLTNAGVNGTVLAILTATRKNQLSFGALVSRDRWSVHVNWGNGNMYFDPGYCCNNPRSFNNVAFEGIWSQYTFLKGTTTVTARQQGAQKFTGLHTSGRCTLNLNFALCHANGTASAYATTKFLEMIMYRTDISAVDYEEIEENQMTFWGL